VVRRANEMFDGPNSRYAPRAAGFTILLVSTYDTLEHYCPMCGYNLRGAASERCSECGGLVGGGIVSRIPWMQRRWRGRARSFWRTAWMVLRRPGSLARESNLRIPRRDARNFFRVSLAMTTLLGTGFAVVAFLILDKQWKSVLPEVPGYPPRPDALVDPLFALWDSPLALIPTALSIASTSWINSRLTQLLLGMGAEPGGGRRCTRHLITFFAALPMWSMMVLGPLAIFVAIALEQVQWQWTVAGGLMSTVAWTAMVAVTAVSIGPMISFSVRVPARNRSWRAWYLALLIWQFLLFCIIIALLVLKDDLPRAFDELTKTIKPVLWILPGMAFLGLLASLGVWRFRLHILRVTYLVAVYPALQLLGLLVVAVPIFWLCGFLAMCLGSMFR